MSKSAAVPATGSAGREKRAAEILSFILQNVDNHPVDVARLVGKRFSISRQMANRYVALLVADGRLEARGKTRARQYSLRCIVNSCHTIRIAGDTAEDEVWRHYVAPDLVVLPKHVLKICEYGFTEMLNNVIEHSEADKAKVLVKLDAVKVRLVVFDYGIGIFSKLARDLDITDPRVAMMELLKGKLTTAREHHSGQGIFFTTRMFDRFSLLSGRLFFTHIEEDDDFLVDTGERNYDSIGTSVAMQISVSSARTTSSVFDRFSVPELEGFGRTHVYVKLSAHKDEGLVSRSQARRLVARLEEFEEVVLDFEGVEMIGQAFADELFRVFATSHSSVNLRWDNANSEVARMIRWVKAGVSAEQRVLPF